jgi:hypothetical protein
VEIIITIILNAALFGLILPQGFNMDWDWELCWLFGVIFCIGMAIVIPVYLNIIHGLPPDVSCEDNRKAESCVVYVQGNPFVLVPAKR